MALGVCETAAYLVGSSMGYFDGSQLAVVPLLEIKLFHEQQWIMFALEYYLWSKARFQHNAIS
jgi:hypothetical protein